MARLVMNQIDTVIAYGCILFGVVVVALIVGSLLKALL